MKLHFVKILKIIVNRIHAEQSIKISNEIQVGTADFQLLARAQLLIVLTPLFSHCSFCKGKQRLCQVNYMHMHFALTLFVLLCSRSLCLHA